ncbi:MAG: response regulator, partial [Clostridia bacterium]|nr:response regulator [Clostridia bacterium]
MIALCVDDEVLLLEALTSAVKASPDIHQVVAFEDEYDALEWVRDHRPDMAFLDIQLHDLNGMELAEALRKVYPELPVVFCTGYREYAV